MAIRALDHIQIAMPEGGEAAARQFYSVLLGLEEIAKPTDLQHRGGCWFVKGTVHVHLGVEQEFQPARKAHPGFLVDDLPALRDKLVQSGFSCQDDLPLPGFTRCYVDDPFGNRIELMQMAENSGG